MAKYAFLIKTIDNPSFWVDHDLTTSGDVITISDSYATSGVVDITNEVGTNRVIYNRYPSTAITAIEVYYPLT